LSRSTNKLNEVIGQAFSGGGRAPPGSAEGVNVTRAMTNELDAARFDPLLVKAVAKIASSTLDIMLSRTENLVRALPVVRFPISRTKCLRLRR
jgi:hypothetical protein